jgi:hypothetical protein
MSGEPSIVRKTESAIDDLLDLWHRRKLVCVIVILFVAVPLAFGSYQQFVEVPKLKSEISLKQHQIEDLQASIQKAEHERDKAQIQLAPFLAAAERTFPNIPPDQRLEFLLAKLEQAIGSVQDAARRISPERILETEVKNTLVSNLKAVQPLDVEITCVLGDTEGFALASQIKSMFEAAGWKVNGVNQAVFTAPIKHLILTFGKAPTPQLQHTLAPLFDSLGYAREASLDDKLGESNLKIVVGSK